MLMWRFIDCWRKIAFVLWSLPREVRGQLQHSGGDAVSCSRTLQHSVCHPNGVLICVVLRLKGFIHPPYKTEGRRGSKELGSQNNLVSGLKRVSASVIEPCGVQPTTLLLPRCTLIISFLFPKNDHINSTILFLPQSSKGSWKSRSDLSQTSEYSKTWWEYPCMFEPHSESGSLFINAPRHRVSSVSREDSHSKSAATASCLMSVWIKMSKEPPSILVNLCQKDLRHDVIWTILVRSQSRSLWV